MPRSPGRPNKAGWAVDLLVLQAICFVVGSVFALANSADSPGTPDLTRGQWIVLAAGAAVATVVFVWCAYRLNRRDNRARIIAVVSQILVYAVPACMSDALAANPCGLIIAIVVVYQLTHVTTRRWCRGETVKDSLA